MAEIRYSLLHRLVQSIAASPPGAWFFARTLHHFDRPFLALTGGRATLSGLLAGVPIVTVTTRGARSGLPRTTPLICIHDRERPEAFALIATNWGQAHYPAWYFNLKANPEADCRLQGRAGRYRAHEAAGEEYDRFWQYATAVYRGYPLYKQRISGRRIPILIMTPIQA
jgi:deazaflavin-dependent oxidoreductase (nitroreductase family)